MGVPWLSKCKASSRHFSGSSAPDLTFKTLQLTCSITNLILLNHKSILQQDYASLKIIFRYKLAFHIFTSFSSPCAIWFQRWIGILTPRSLSKTKLNSMAPIHSREPTKEGSLSPISTSACCISLKENTLSNQITWCWYHKNETYSF